MRVLGFSRTLLSAVVLLVALLPSGLEAQLRPVVSNVIGKSDREASLRLGFENGEELTISFHDGQVFVDNEVIGAYSRNDALDSAWQALLGRVISLDDGPLGQALFDWTPPPELKGDEAAVAEAIDQTLEGALAPSPDVQARSMEGDQSEPEGAEGSLLQALLSRTGALSGLAEALDGLPLQHPTVRVGEDLRVGEGETLEGTVILVDGDLDVEGTIRGDVVVSGGTVRLLETGSITGDLRVADGTVERLGGSVEGSVLDLNSADRLSVDRAELQSLREELESEIRRDVLASVERDRRHSRGLFS